MLKMQAELTRAVLDAMMQHDWNQAQVAVRADISQKHLSTLLSGGSAGSLEVWDRLCEVLGVEVWAVITQSNGTQRRPSVRQLSDV